MKNTGNKLLTNAIGQIMRPLIPILLRNGIAYDRFEKIVRKAYVDQAIAKAQRKNHQATISSVSAETGISRKKIKRLSNNELSDIENHEELIRTLGKDTCEPINSFNSNQNIIDASHWFQRKVFNPGLDQDRLAEYREYLLRQSQALLEETELT